MVVHAANGLSFTVNNGREKKKHGSNFCQAMETAHEDIQMPDYRQVCRLFKLLR